MRHQMPKSVVAPTKPVVPKPFNKAAQLAKADQLRKPRVPQMVPDADMDAV